MFPIATQEQIFELIADDDDLEDRLVSLERHIYTLVSRDLDAQELCSALINGIFHRDYLAHHKWHDNLG